MSYPAASPQPQTFTAEQAVELAVVERSGFVESRHIGSAVVVDTGRTGQNPGDAGAPSDRGLDVPAPSERAGVPAASEQRESPRGLALGAPDEPVLTRSCLKPLQAIACMELGVPLSGETAVLATASHKAERGHVDVVEKMLASVNLSEQDLQCPSVQPADRDSRIVTRGTGRLTSPLYFNCSGKHTAFLMAQKLNNQPTADYLQPDSLVQRRVADVVTRYCGAAPSYTGTDGCGAPVHALTLTQLATGIGRIASGTTPEARHLMDSVFAYPWAIEGHGRPNTTVIEQLGVFAKFGAEGMMVMSTRSGVAVAVKMLDGNNRASSLVALELLVAAGALDAGPVLDVLGDIVPAVTGGTKSDGAANTVGEIKTSAAIQELLRVRAGGGASPSGVAVGPGAVGPAGGDNPAGGDDSETMEMRVR